MSEKITVPVKKNMWAESDDSVNLIASRCKKCGEVYFPAREADFCAHCYAEELEEIKLSNTGVISSYTTVVYPPAGGFYTGPVPFNYIIAEFPEGVYVPGHYIGVDPDEINIGDEIKTVVDVLAEDDEKIVMSYKFAPADSSK